MSALRDRYKELRKKQQELNDKANGLARPYWDEAMKMSPEVEEAATALFLDEFVGCVEWVLREGHAEGCLVLDPKDNESLDPFFDLIYDGMHHGGFYLNREEEIYFHYDDNEYQITFSSCKLALEFIGEHDMKVDVSPVKKVLDKLLQHADNLQKLLDIMGKGKS